MNNKTDKDFFNYLRNGNGVMNKKGESIYQLVYDNTVVSYGTLGEIHEFCSNKLMENSRNNENE
jgi:hypothetical protein